jgi:hypothetical protein
MSSTQQAPRRASSGIRLAAAVVATALVSVPAVALAARTHTHKSVQSVSIKAVVGSGVMTPTKHGFAPGKAATRGQLAIALHRSIPRLVMAEVGSSVAASASGELAALAFTVPGAAHKNQAVLITFNGQLDHDNALSAGCFPSFSITRGTSTTVLAARTQELYGTPQGGLELPVSMSFLIPEKTDRNVTYHLNLTNPCSATLFIDGGDLSASNVVLGGNGQAMPSPARSQVQHTLLHDR